MSPTDRAAHRAVELAADLDAADPLAHLRDRFDLAPDMSYLDGNSLGAPLRSVADRLSTVVREQWAGRLIRSWDEGWWDAPERIGDRIAPLVGAAAGQVVVGDSTSVNLFKLLVAGTRLRPERDEILLDAATFPTDGYVAAEAAELTGRTLRRVPVAEVADAVSERTAVVLLNLVDYISGRLHDLPALTAAVHAAGAVLCWDLCHGVGAIPVQLDAENVDLAVGCTYKFLGGGPGAPAFCYVAARHQEAFRQPLVGWAGHRDPFGMTADYVPGAGITRARSGTPDILSMLALDAALDLWDEVDIAAVRAKALALGEFFFACCAEVLPRTTVLTPRAPDARGNQIALARPRARLEIARLAECGVLGDFRPPDVLRFGLTPYVRYADVARAVSELAASSIMD